MCSKKNLLVGENMWYRISNVKLGQFRVGRDQMAWFPVHGELDSFASGDRFLTEPVSRETYDVVRGSLVFNQDLPDARFSLDWDERKSSSLDPWQQEFREKQSHAKPKPAHRTDPAGVEQDLNRRLAEADEQARCLEGNPTLAPHLEQHDAGPGRDRDPQPLRAGGDDPDQEAATW